MPKPTVQEIVLNDGRVIKLETGKYAKQANGSVVLTMENTTLLATVVASEDVQGDVDFMPLTVDYREKFSAAGRMPGGFFKREARPTDGEVLTMRLVDRALRPLFPDDFHANTQVMIQLLSADKEVAPDSLACLAASSALAISDIPFNGPVSEVRVIRLNGEFKLNPSIAELDETDLDLVVAGTVSDIMMVEGRMDEVSEEDMLEALAFAQEALKVQCKAQADFATAVHGDAPKREYCHERVDEELKADIFEKTFQKYYDVAKQCMASKKDRSSAFSAIKTAYLEEKFGEEEYDTFLVSQLFKSVQKKAIREMMLTERKRLDGRETTEIRDIWSEVDVLPGVHGSSVFTRGETQSLTSLTLGTSLDAQSIDGVLEQRSENFMLHYNFPPFSTGEARPIRGVSRREVGHGNLALRALRPVLPETPYVIRLISDILESNGSSSMATVCAGTLALMDAGVQIKKPVSGIAMGMVSDTETNRHAILSDILGDEDHLGDMDFKVTGTRDGITACQMDIKIDGLSYELLAEALNQAKEGRLHILDKIEETMTAPREDYKSNVPRIESFDVPGDMIGAIIGPGGKVIQALQKETETVITISENEDGKTGNVQIASANKAHLDEAMERVKLIAFPPVAVVGETYKGKVKSIMPYGAFVEVVPGTDGLIHVSEIDWTRVENVEDVLKVGEEVEFKVVDKDKKTGKLKLSRKILLPRPPKEEKKEVKKEETK